MHKYNAAAAIGKNNIILVIRPGEYFRFFNDKKICAKAFDSIMLKISPRVIQIFS